MIKKEVDRLHHIGVYDDEMYEKIMSNMTVNENGKLTGIVPNMADAIYGLKFNPNNYNLIDIVKESTPWIGADIDFPDLFGKYGYTYCGIFDVFDWFTEGDILDFKHKPLEEASELEMWQMIALSNMYWYHNYKEWYNDKKV